MFGFFWLNFPINFVNLICFVLFGQVNNHKPTFDHSSYTFNIVENNYTNDKMKLGVLRARDEDIGRNGLVEYLISSNVASGNVLFCFFFVLFGFI